METEQISGKSLRKTFLLFGSFLLAWKLLDVLPEILALFVK